MTMSFQSSMQATFLGRMAREVYMPPFAASIPLDYRPLHGKSRLSIVWRKMRPGLALWWHGQRPLQRSSMDVAYKRVLWIYKGVPQVGDALMDLSSRVLLRERGLTIDLYTDPHLRQLFRADDVFSRVFSDVADARQEGYDLVIVDSFKWRCIQEKIRHFGQAPFVTMRGYFSGPEFNRTLFSFFRMNQLLHTSAQSIDVQRGAVPHLSSTREDGDLAERLGIQGGAIAFAIGGASPGRTYMSWDHVIRILFERKSVSQIVLLGSANALPMRDKIMRAVQLHGAEVIDCVDRNTLPQAFEILKRCVLAVCADGGLLHLANAAGIRTVSLFDQHVGPEMRLTAANNSIALQSAGQVSDLPAAKVVEAIKQALAISAPWERV